MTKIAVLDDWQRVARKSADWTPLIARADVKFLETPFADEGRRGAPAGPSRSCW